MRIDQRLEEGELAAHEQQLPEFVLNDPRDVLVAMFLFTRVSLPLQRRTTRCSGVTEITHAMSGAPRLYPLPQQNRTGRHSTRPHTFSQASAARSRCKHRLPRLVPRLRHRVVLCAAARAPRESCPRANARCLAFFLSVCVFSF